MLGDSAAEVLGDAQKPRSIRHLEMATGASSQARCCVHVNEGRGVTLKELTQTLLFSSLQQAGSSR